MGDVIKGVGAVAGGISNLVGGGGGGGASAETNTITIKGLNPNEAPVSTRAAAAVAEHQLNGLEDQLSHGAAATQLNVNDIDKLFKNALTQFVTGSTNPTPEQMQAATSYVDQTFTIPAQQQFGRFLDQAQTASSDRAAAMGRSATDTAFQRELAGQASNVAQDLTNQRGSLIAQRADYLQNQLPQQQLGQLLLGGQYFNNSLNSAMTNRLNLLNAATGQQNLGLQSMIAGGTTQVQDLRDYQMSGASLGSNLTQLGNAAGAAAGPIGSALGKVFKTPSRINPLGDEY